MRDQTIKVIKRSLTVRTAENSKTIRVTKPSHKPIRAGSGRKDLTIVTTS